MRKLLLLSAGMLCLFMQLMAQQVITGKVTDDKGNPLPNASVLVKGTTSGISTKTDGSYSITIPPNARTLVFSSVNMTTVEMPIGKESELNVVLRAEDKTLSEVVVVGYGTQRRKDVTGAVSSIKGSEIAERPVQSFDQTLAGRASGVQITMPSGVLNTPPVFRIRGTNSISLSSYPLIIIDGVPSYTGDYSQTNAAGNALASINVNDIESIDIAKDAAATAIYGSSAANGVVFITTKKGRPGKARVTYDAWVGWNSAVRLPKVLNASQYISFKGSTIDNYNSIAASIGLSPTSVKFNSVNGPDGNPVDTKWSDKIYRQGLSQNHAVSISGGSDATTYYFSTGYTSQEGIIRRNNFKRLNVLFNGDTKINSYLSAGIKLSFSNEENLASSSSGSLSGEAFNTGGLGRLAIVLPPIISPYKDDGSYNLNGAAIGSSNINGIGSLSYYNPVPLLDLNRSNSENNHIQSNAYVQLKPVKWITLKSMYGIDYMFVNYDLFWSPVAGDGYSYSGYATSGTSKYKTWIWDNTIQFDYSIANKHNINLLVGNEQRRRTTLAVGLNRQTLSDPAYNVIQAGFTTNNPAGLGYGENYLLSTFGRLEYNFNRKYYLQGNIRQDEYSGLGIKKGVFWGASAGWEISKEKFWESAGLDRTFSSFKFRGSYGKVGNSGIGDYSSYSAFGSGLYGGAATLAYSSVGNADLKWETSKKLDIGFSFGLFHDRLTGEFAYYKNTVDGLILNVAQAPSTGLPSNPPQNIGSLYNKGFELTLNSTPISKENFSWNTSFTLGINKNMVTSLAPGLEQGIQSSTAGLETVSLTKVGYSLGYLWVVRTGGVDPTTGKRIFINSAGTPIYFTYLSSAAGNPKTYQYSTSSDNTAQYTSPKGGTSVNQANDAVMYANAIPKQIGGWNNTVTYKQFSLDFLFTYQFGFSIYYGTNAGLHDQRWWNNSTDVLTDAWTAKGDANKKYARPVYNDNVSNGSAFPLDINVFKGDFVKLKNLTFSYSIPKSIINKAKISNLRIYVSGQNLAVFTKYPGPDPEVSSNGNSTTSQGVDRNTAVNGRTVLFGVNITF